jgi:hypothetical protein
VSSLLSSELAPRRASLIGAVLAAGICGYLATGNAAEAQAIQAAGPELTRLLRGMALIKALIAAIMAAAVFWRLQFPITQARLAAYITACAAMAAGPFLVWGMAHIIAGAMLLHAGLLAAVLLGWRDEVAGQAVKAATQVGLAASSLPYGALQAFIWSSDTENA